MDRRNFLMNSARLMLVTSGLFITGKVLVACDKDDNNNYYGGYYSGGYYDDKQSISQNQQENPILNQNEVSANERQEHNKSGK